MDLQGRLLDSTGVGKAGVAVNLYNVTDTGTSLASTTTAATTGLWAFTGKDDSIVYAVKIGPDGTSYIWLFGSIDVQVTNISAAIRQTPDPTELTVTAGGAITITQDYHSVTPNSGDSDDISTILGGYMGQEVMFEPASGKVLTFTRTATPGANQIASKTNKTMSGYDLIRLKFNGTYWKFAGLYDNT